MASRCSRGRQGEPCGERPYDGGAPCPICQRVRSARFRGSCMIELWNLRWVSSPRICHPSQSEDTGKSRSPCNSWPLHHGLDAPWQRSRHMRGDCLPRYPSPVSLLLLLLLLHPMEVEYGRLLLPLLRLVEVECKESESYRRLVRCSLLVGATPPHAGMPLDLQYLHCLPVGATLPQAVPLVGATRPHAAFMGV